MIPEDLRHWYEALDQHRQNNAACSCNEVCKLIERIAALEAENARLKWVAKERWDCCSKDIQALHQERDALKALVAQIHHDFPEAHCAPMAYAHYPEFWVIRATREEWADTLGKGSTPAQAWKNAAEAVRASAEEKHGR